jgi:23S rRNA (uracil1939-C5)-methyltransferase
VHRTAPGDRVEVAITARKERWARGRLLRVIEPSADGGRRPAPTTPVRRVHAGAHALSRAAASQGAHRGGRAGTRIGRLDVAEPEVVPSPREHRYRNRVSFALRGAGGGRVVAGFHALGDPERVVDLDGRCLLPEEAISRVWDALRAAWGPDARLLPSGERLRLTLRANAAGEVSLLIEGGFTPGRPIELLAAVEGLTSVWHRPVGPVRN